VKRPRLHRLVCRTEHGRRYHAAIEIVYTGGLLPSGACESLISAVGAALGEKIPDLSCTVSSHPYSRVTISATLVENRPLAALTRLDSALDESLMAAGLFEEFDVTGKVLRVAPHDHVWREPTVPARERA
jgi:hypothetical protein